MTIHGMACQTFVRNYHLMCSNQYLIERLMDNQSLKNMRLQECPVQHMQQYQQIVLV